MGLLLAGIFIAACADEGITDPVAVELGETTFVFVLNPTVNDANEQEVPAPGASVSDVSVSVQDGPSGTTGTDGVVAFGPVEAGTRIVSFGNTGELSLSISSGDLREVAVALDEGGAAQMADVAYQFDDQTVVEITPDMAISDVNDELAKSSQIVLLRGGTYTGDLEFSGSNVTLFGEGAEGGNVTIEGSGLTALGNAGMSPLTAPASC